MQHLEPVKRPKPATWQADIISLCDAARLFVYFTALGCRMMLYMQNLCGSVLRVMDLSVAVGCFVHS